MDGFIMAAQLILALSILVILHEVGHYLAARAFGIKVEKFYLFFDAWGIKLFKFKKGETEYGIGWLPLGGYVKIAGMIDESMDKEQLSKPAQPWEFRSKPAWKRLIVMVAGVFMNAVLGVAVFSGMIYKYGDSYLPNDQLKYGVVSMQLGKEIGIQTGDKIIAINNKKIDKFKELSSAEVLFGENINLKVDRNGEIINIPVPDKFFKKFTNQVKGESVFLEPRHTFFVDKVVSGSNAEKAGLKHNDKIIKINDKEIRFFDEIRDYLQLNKNKEVNLIVVRDNKEISLKSTVDENGRLGFFPGTNDFKYSTIYYDFLTSLKIGNERAWGAVFLQIKTFGMLFKGELSPKHLSGPIGIAGLFGGIWDWINFWSLVGLLSMLLAFINILPIPALDGGHTLFLTIEVITRKKFSDKFMEYAQITGMIILLTIMVFAFGNDIFKIFNK